MKKDGSDVLWWFIFAVFLAFLIFATMRSLDIDALLGRDTDAAASPAPTPDPVVKGRGCVPMILGPLCIVLRLLLGRGT